jgi:polyhydroxyalkanoate synthesis regulator phasin
MLDAPPEFETMRTLVRKLTTDAEAIKADLKEANAAIEELRAEVVKLKAQQIARGHDPD